MVVGNNDQILQIKAACVQCNPETRWRRQHQSGKLETFSISVWCDMVWYMIYDMVWYGVVVVVGYMVWVMGMVKYRHEQRVTIHLEKELSIH